MFCSSALPSKRRILNELCEISAERSDEFTAGPENSDDVYHWNASIKGPPDSPYEDGVFFLCITFPDDYPLKPPTVSFTTPVYHPNVTELGNIGLPCLGIQWPICYTIAKVLVSIRALLYAPDLDNVVRPTVADIYRYNRELFDQLARQSTIIYAMCDHEIEDEDQEEVEEVVEKVVEKVVEEVLDEVVEEVVEEVLDEVVEEVADRRPQLMFTDL